jgi:hypothetical protein
VAASRLFKFCELAQRFERGYALDLERALRATLRRLALLALLPLRRLRGRR